MSASSRGRVISGVGLLAGVGLVAYLFSRRRSNNKATTRPQSVGSPFSRLLIWIFEKVNRFVQWYNLPFVLSVLNLIAIRNQLRERNLHDTQNLTHTDEPPPDPRYLTARTVDGSYNDLTYPEMGQAGTRFARNFPLEYTYPEEPPALYTPSPRRISLELMTRHKFVPAETLNLLAAAWIQFQVHDWFNHGDNEVEDSWKVPLESDDPWPEHPMEIQRTAQDPSWPPGNGNFPPTYINPDNHWWDGSQIYGSDEGTMARLRSGVDGKVIIGQDGLLPTDPETGIDITGFSENWWLGLSLLHTLFTLEHNSICDRLRGEYPHWSDDEIFDRARLINAALMAKIHTVEWTPGILRTPVIRFGMRGNWWGIMGERFYRRFGRISKSEIISGVMGSPTDHQTGIFAMTEEFAAVYRMHPLIPDEFGFRSAVNDALLQERTLPEVVFAHARERLDEMSMTDVLYSFGTSHPGAITLHNFPRFLQKLERPDGPTVDMAAVDVLRDRERGVPRYNKFRELVHMPRVNTFEELTDNPEWAEEIRRVYGNDIDRVDLMVGLYAEPPPPGFGFSDTAFRIFILMASRRLKSDRFFTTDYTPDVYTPEGIQWIAENSMLTVLLRHYPDLEPTLRHVDNAFAPWPKTTV